MTQSVKLSASLNRQAHALGAQCFILVQPKLSEPPSYTPYSFKT